MKEILFVSNKVQFFQLNTCLCLLYGPARPCLQTGNPQGINPTRRHRFLSFLFHYQFLGQC